MPLRAPLSRKVVFACDLSRAFQRWPSFPILKPQRGPGGMGAAYSHDLICRTAGRPKLRLKKVGSTAARRDGIADGLQARRRRRDHHLLCRGCGEEISRLMMFERLQKQSLLGLLYNFFLVLLYFAGFFIGSGVNTILGFLIIVGLGVLAFFTRNLLKLSTAEGYGVAIIMIVAYIIMAFFWELESFPTK